MRLTPSAPPWLVGLLLVGSLCASPAFADEAAHIGTQAGWQLMGGLSTGGSFGDFGGSGYLGGELSLNRLSQRWWMGLYGDGVYEFGHGAGYFTAGPQLGYAILGFDGGVALRTGDVDSAVGFAARGLIALAVFDIYGRVLVFDDEEQVQIGVLIKLPFWASE